MHTCVTWPSKVSIQEIALTVVYKHIPLANVSIFQLREQPLCLKLFLDIIERYLANLNYIRFSQFCRGMHILIYFKSWENLGYGRTDTCNGKLCKIFGQVCYETSIHDDISSVIPAALCFRQTTWRHSYYFPRHKNAKCFTLRPVPCNYNNPKHSTLSNVHTIISPDRYYVLSTLNLSMAVLQNLGSATILSTKMGSFACK